MNWTEEQKKAIEIRDKSILVSAAAGSGKTAVLVERIKQIIQKDGLSVDQLLVVTFTNAAASEMREKIVSAIPEQMNKIHKAHISTFHAFSLDVIRRYFHLIDLEPGFKICDEAQRILLQNQAMEQLFHDCFQRRDEDFLLFLRLYAGSKNEEAVKSLILNLHSFLQSLPDPFGWLERKIEVLAWDEQTFRESELFQEMLADIYEELESVRSDCMSVLQAVEESGLASLEPKAKADLDMAEEILDRLKEDFDSGVCLLKNATFQRFNPSGEDKAAYADIREDITFLRNRAKDSIKKLIARYFSKPFSEYITEINQTYQAALILRGLVLEFDALYRQQKKKKGLLDFSDIEHFALKILSDEAAASEYRNKFKYIFIDEYQDSNLVQEAIIERIRQRDNVFMVGDVKQSIYKFRLAEPEIFINKYERFRRGADPYAIKLDLNRNFRSKEPIIQLANHVFGRIMNRRSAGIDYDEAAALYKGVSYEGSLEHKAELHLVEDRQIEDETLDEEIVEMKKAELEAYVAATLIKQNIGLPYYDEKTKQQRLLGNRDMVILLRSAAGIAEIYCEALEREGIPAYMDTGDGYFDTLEISVFLNLLKVIDNRRQDVPLLSVLRSPIFGFSVAELAEIRVAYKTGSYFDALLYYSGQGERRELKERCERSLSLIAKWKQKAKVLPLPDFLWELIRETGYYSYVGALPGGNQRQGNLRALVDRGSAYENSSGKGLFGFINYIDAVRKGKIASAPTKLLGENDDVVRIMTVHKSKGLEFPFVLVGGLGRGFHREKGGVASFHKQLGVALRQVDKERCCYRKTLLQNIIEARLSREEMAEEIRILYVALTRPMDKLVLLGAINDAESAMKRARSQGPKTPVKARSYLDLLLPALSDYQEIMIKIHNRGVISVEKKQRPNSEQMLKKAIDQGFIVEDSLYGMVARRLNWSYGYPTALKNKSKYTVSELSREGEKPERRAIGTEAASKGALRGTVYHAIMEKIPLQVDWNRERIAEFVEDLVHKEILTAEEIRSVDLTKILHFLESPLGRRLQKADRVYREEAFNLLMEKDGEEIIVQGIIDCYFAEGEKYTLIDFKSDFVTDKPESIAALKETYRPQLELYRQALEQIRGVRVAETYLYLFAIDEAVKL
ncbi:MAG: helicase-exonuclease AddAB subunit AddA [Anaerovoracaceae bacterium]|jgi:ATP-dependent helicase/nuclease subunit A